MDLIVDDVPEVCANQVVPSVEVPIPPRCVPYTYNPLPYVIAYIVDPVPEVIGVQVVPSVEVDRPPIPVPYIYNPLP
jgi:hypothetical protein